MIVPVSLNREVLCLCCRSRLDLVRGTIIGAGGRYHLQGPLHAAQIQAAFSNDMHVLYVSHGKEMLQCANDSSSSSTSDSSSRPLHHHYQNQHLTFGEFCSFAHQIKKCHDERVNINGLSSPMKKSFDKHGTRNCLKNYTTKMTAKHQVFLGGSCNPTTWRHDIAIPLLRQLGISYYNPQVDQWEPQLMELEYKAKENASILFFVINNETRNVAGIIEAAHLAGARRRLMLVMNMYHSGQKLCGEIISQQEFQELNMSLRVLKDLVESQGMPVFSDIHSAINCTAQILRDDPSTKPIGNPIDLGAPSWLNGTTKFGTLKDVFHAFDSSFKSRQINLSDVCVAFRTLMHRKLTVPELKRIVTSRADSGKSSSNEINFKDFCLMLRDLNAQNHFPINPTSTSPLTSNGAFNTTTTMDAVADPCCSGVTRNVSLGNIHDVYIGGYSSDFSWAEDIVIPLLRQNNLSYYCDYNVYNDCGSDASAMNNCYSMLFYVPNNARALATMTMAAHFIGLGCNVVLCVEHLIEEHFKTSIKNADKSENCVDRMNKQSLNDYNRGRMYLIDLAKRDNIPVLDNIMEATNCLVGKFIAQK